MKTKFIVRVHRPEISQEEHNRRMNQIHRAAENVLKAQEKGAKSGKI